MNRIIKAAALKDYKIKVGFSDGTEGIIDLSDLKGKGVFSVWNDINVFNSVFINNESHTVSWPGGIDLCPDVLYAEVTGKDIDSVLKSNAGV